MRHLISHDPVEPSDSRVLVVSFQEFSSQNLDVPRVFTKYSIGMSKVFGIPQEHTGFAYILDDAFSPFEIALIDTLDHVIDTKAVAHLVPSVRLSVKRDLLVDFC